MLKKENQQNAGKNLLIQDKYNRNNLKNTDISLYKHGSNFGRLKHEGDYTVENVVDMLLNPSEDDDERVNELIRLYNSMNKAKQDEETDKAKALEEEFQRKKSEYFLSATFAGTFEGESCRKDGFVKNSNLVALDFDHISKNKVDEIHEKIKADKYCFLTYKTASGCGLRVVFISGFTDEKSYLKAWYQVANYLKETYGIEPDEGTKNINRLMKLNPNGAYVNWEAATFETVEEQTQETVKQTFLSETSNVGTSSEKSVNPKNIPAYVSKVVNDVLNTLLVESVNGNRNINLNKASYTLGQYEHYKLYNEEEIYSITREIALKLGLSESEIKNTINSGWSSGKQNPVYLCKWEVGRNGK